MDRGKDLFLFFGLYAERVERLPCAAVRADNDIICFFEFLFAYGAGIALVISHVWSSEFFRAGSVILPIHLVPLRPKRRKRNNLAILYTICPWKAKNFS